MELESLGPFDLAYLLKWKVISGQTVPRELLDRALKAGGEMFDQAHVRSL
jgi:hypothetical protein